MGRQPALPPHPLPPGLCYDHLRPHFVKFQPQLPLVQKHFDPLHALRGRKAQAVRPKRCGKNRAGGSRGGGGGAPHGPSGKLGGKRPGDGSRSSGCSRENPAPKPGERDFRPQHGDAGQGGRAGAGSCGPQCSRGGEEKDVEHPEPAPARILPARPPLGAIPQRFGPAALKNQPEEIYTPPMSNLHPQVPLLQAGVVCGGSSAPLAPSFFTPTRAARSGARRAPRFVTADATEGTIYSSTMGWEVQWIPFLSQAHIARSQNKAEAPRQTLRGSVAICTRWVRASGRAVQARDRCPYPREQHPQREEVSPRGFTCQWTSGAPRRGSAAAEGEAISVEKPRSPRTGWGRAPADRSQYRPGRAGMEKPRGGPARSAPACSALPCRELRLAGLPWEPTHVPGG